MANIPEWAKPINTPEVTEVIAPVIPEWANPMPIEPTDLNLQPAPTVAQPITEEAQSTISTEREPIYGDLGAKISERVDKTADMVDRSFSGGTASDIANIPKVVTLGIGQVAGVGVDIIDQGISDIAGAVISEPVKKFGKEKVSELLQTDIGTAGVKALQAGQEEWNGFSEQHPDIAMLLEGVFNVASFGISGKLAHSATRFAEVEIRRIAKDGAMLVSKLTPKEIDSQIFNVVKDGLVKGARPGVEKKRTFGQMTAFFNKGKQGVEAIIENKGSLQLLDEAGEVMQGVLPKNLHQFSQAISQTKEQIYKKYDELAKQTGQLIDIEPIKKELLQFASNDQLYVAAPGVRKHTLDLLSRLEEVGDMTASQAQQQIKFLNSRLDGYYANPSYKEALNAHADAILVNNLRKRLDDTINSATGGNYQTLKNQYGALSTIERDVNRRMIVDLRKEVKGLVDFSDIFSGAEAVRAIINKSPSGFASAATMKSMANFIKRKKDPNLKIQKMFENVENLVQQKQHFTPKSAAFRKMVEAQDDFAKYKKTKLYEPAGRDELNRKYIGLLN